MQSESSTAEASNSASSSPGSMKQVEVPAHGEGALARKGALHKNPGADVESYDLTGKSRAMRGGMPGLEIFGERFSISFRRTLSSALRQTCELRPVSTEVIKFADFILQVPRPTGLFVFQLEPLPGGCAVVIDGQLLMALVDSMCGGGEKDLEENAPQAERDLTNVELRLLRRMAQPLTEDISYAWEPLASLKASFDQIVVRPELSHLADEPESILFSVFEVSVGGFKSPLGVLIPMSTIEPIKERLMRVSHVPGHVRGGRGSRVAEHLPEIDVDVCVELGRAEVDVRTLMGLNVGDVLRLDSNAEAPLVATVEDKVKFRGSPDAAGSTLVFVVGERTG